MSNPKETLLINVGLEQEYQPKPVTEASIRQILPEKYPSLWKTPAVRDGDIHNPPHPVRSIILAFHVCNYLEHLGIAVNRDALIISLLIHDTQRENDTQDHDREHGLRAARSLDTQKIMSLSPFKEIREKNPGAYTLAQRICAVHSEKIFDNGNAPVELIVHKIVDGLERQRDRQNPLDFERVWKKLAAWENLGFEQTFLKNLAALDMMLIKFTGVEMKKRHIKHGSQRELELTLELAKRLGLLS